MATQTLSGAFIEVIQVEDYGGVETETLLDLTADDVEISIDETENSREIHSQRRAIRERTYNTADVDITSLVDPSHSALVATGIIDDTDDGKVVFDTDSRTWEACRLKVYEDKEDASPAQVADLVDVEWMTDGVTYASDFAEEGLTGMIHGDIYLNVTQA